MAEGAVERVAAMDRWERVTEWPLMVAAVLFLVAYALPILDPTGSAWLLSWCRLISWVTWCMFGIDLVVRVLFADRRGRYLIHHWYDVLIMVLPLLRPLRPLRLLRLIPLLSILNRRARTRLRGRVAIYVVGGAALLAFVAALAVLDAERGSPGANILDFGDAMWWAVATMTTVGYGDRFPSTGIGRLVAFGLMVGGIALLGTVTATIASWLVEAVASEKEQTEDVQEAIHRLEAKIDELRALQTSLSESSESSRELSRGES